MRGKIFDYCQHKLSPEESTKIEEIILNNPKIKDQYIEIKNYLTKREIYNKKISKREINIILNSVYQQAGIPVSVQKNSFRILRPALYIACTFILILSSIIGTDYLIKSYNQKQALKIIAQIQEKTPKGNVELKLSDGEEIILGEENKGTNLKRKSIKIISQGNKLNIRENTNTANINSSKNNNALQQTKNLNYLTVKTKNDFYLTLQDGSEVWLREGSKFGFKDEYKDERYVELEGEAYFSVKKDPSRPFIIKVNGALVRVVGTQFNLQSKKDGETIKVSMNEGVVNVKCDKISEEISLTKDKELILNNNNGKYNISDIDSYKYKGWIDGYFIFIKESLKDVMCQLSEWYNVPIVVDNDNFDINEFNGKLNRENTLNKQILILKETYDFNFYYKDNALHIK